MLFRSPRYHRDLLGIRLHLTYASVYHQHGFFAGELSGVQLADMDVGSVLGGRVVFDSRPMLIKVMFSVPKSPLVDTRPRQDDIAATPPQRECDRGGKESLKWP